MPHRLFWWMWLTAMSVPTAGHAVSVCGACHRAQAGNFASTGMAQALQPTSDLEVFKRHPRLAASLGGYSYAIERTVDGVTYSVSDGKDTIRAIPMWTFGQGAAGETFVFERDGRWYESRVSYYAAPDGLDYTMGSRNSLPQNLAEAAGKLMSPVETADCFGCHATGAVRASALNLAAMKPGVQCEACHGAAEQHLEAVRTGKGGAAMRKLGAMSPEEMSEFCGRCHRSWSSVAANGPRGILNVRFQPYRLALSKCYQPDDNRIRCTACHDPHQQLVTTARSYDAKCAACHSPSAGHTCRVARQDCVACHMPRIELPGAHRQFTDHRIRIARAGEKYPD